MATTFTVNHEYGNSVTVVPDVYHLLNNRTHPSSPTQLSLELISAKLACDLNTVWHSRLPNIHWSNVVRNTHYICFGVIFENRVYAVGIWSSPVAQNRFTDGKTMLELRRLAICSGAPFNTASWMISKMVKHIRQRFPEISRLISYQDTEVHTGTIYKASNWVESSVSNGISWTTKTRKRTKEQTMAPKIRWEYHYKNRLQRREVKK